MERALIDTSILVEPFAQWKNNEPNYKQTCLALLKGELYPFYNKFEPVVSISVMGEMNLIILEKLSPILKEGKEEIMNNIIKRFFNKCEKVGLTKRTLEVTNNLLSLDERLEPLDAIHIATAISEGCTNFVFIDYALKDNTVVRKFAKENGLNLINFGIKENADTKHPGKYFIH